MKNHILGGLVAVITASALHAQSLQSPGWSPMQATGAPDTLEAGDLPTAWASLAPDGGPEWLELEFEKPAAIAEVRIRETFNPGAITKVVALTPYNGESLIWEGQAPPAIAPVEMVLKPSKPATSNRIKIHLDTTRVPGWNEIDAVELVGTDGSRQWAKNATASSSYADGPTQQSAQNIAEPPAGAKYRELLKTLKVEADQKNYGDFYDYGYWANTSYAGHENLPPGFWVYIAPNWHIFGKSGLPRLGE
jgi:hypothetical protein